MSVERDFLFGLVINKLPYVHQLIHATGSDVRAFGTELRAKELQVVRDLARDPGLFHFERGGVHCITSLIGSQSSCAMASFCPL